MTEEGPQATVKGHHAEKALAHGKREVSWSVALLVALVSAGLVVVIATRVYGLWGPSRLPTLACEPGNRIEPKVAAARSAREANRARAFEASGLTLVHPRFISDDEWPTLFTFRGPGSTSLEVKWIAEQDTEDRLGATAAHTPSGYFEPKPVFGTASDEGLVFFQQKTVGERCQWPPPLEFATDGDGNLYQLIMAADNRTESVHRCVPCATSSVLDLLVSDAHAKEAPAIDECRQQSSIDALQIPEGQTWAGNVVLRYRAPRVTVVDVPCDRQKR